MKGASRKPSGFFDCHPDTSPSLTRYQFSARLSLLRRMILIRMGVAPIR